MRYLNEHGVKLYGAVVTGLTKADSEVEKGTLGERIHPDEVEFWNWDPAVLER